MMTKLLYTFLAVIALSLGASAQSVVITDSTTTRSICFNDGTIHVSASGGTGPYTFTIVSGPAYPNITYPIALPPLSSTFLTIPRGSYTIKVTDANGNTAFATATVAGTYQFPVLTPSVTSNYCISVAVQGGRPPYQYSISSQGTNAGFGAYQSSNIFCVCTGHYWVRVLDSCSNIFTTSQVDVTVPAPAPVSLSVKSRGNVDSIFSQLTSAAASPFTYHLKSGAISVTNSTGIFVVPRGCNADTVTLTDRCGQSSVAIIDPHELDVNVLSDCKRGEAVITIDSESIAPFTITGSGGTITTHSYTTSFTGLPIDSPYHFTITDSCGHIDILTLACDSTPPDTLFFYDVCPFDSSIHMHPNQIQFCFPLRLTCLSCVPTQEDTVYALPARLFTNIDTGVSYTIRIQDSCGFDYTTTYTPHYVPLSISDSIFTCNDFAMMSNPRIYVPPIHYSVYNGSTFIDSATANEPVFYHVPIGSYQVIATHALCYRGVASFVLPILGGRCEVPMFDSACTPSYAVFQPYMASSEVFSLVNDSTGLSYPMHQPRTGSNPMLFDDVPVGNYNLVSDSGCAIPYVLAPYHFTLTASYTRECTGQSQITAVASVNSCNTAQGAYFVLLKDNQYIGGNLSGIFIVSDSGNYVIRLYLSNTTIFIYPAPYDTICPLDTVLLHVDISPIPNVVSIPQEVCGHNTANIPYTIFGGSAPYTVTILGYPTRIVTSTVDTFPDVYPGIYTMVVSDTCGISRSFSVAVIDTCSPDCITQSHLSLSDSVICRGAVVALQNLSVAATHYKWTVNGVTYAYATDTSYTTTVPGTYTITLYAYIGTCVDSASLKLLVEDTLHNSGVKDTFLCTPFSLSLNTHNANSVWSTGTNDSVVSISATGTYWAQLTNSCGTARDSFNISSRQSPLFDLSAPIGYICDDQPDSTLLIATLSDSTGAPVMFIWSTGQTDTSAHGSQIIVYQAGSYTVTVSDGFCALSMDTSIVSSSCDSICFAHIAVPDAFSPNGDGMNDTFHLLHFCEFKPFTMHVYNRWGELVFVSDDIDKGWDGTYKGKQQEEGVYWVYFSLSIEGKKSHYISGRVNLFR